MLDVDQLEELFEEFDDEYCNFEKIENPKNPRSDLCAFIMLHDLLGGTGDMVCNAEHDEIWLDVELKELAEKADRDFIRDLVRCGVRCDGQSLSMFA